MYVTPEQVVRAVLWCVVSTTAIVASFVWAQVEATDPTTIALGVGGIVGLVGLVWKLVTDYRSTSELIDDYQAALRDERDENRHLREEIKGMSHRKEPRQGDPPS